MKPLLVFALLLFLAGCSSKPEVHSTRPQRVISLVPSVTELVCAVGAEDRLVGVTLNDNYPPSVSRLPKVGDQTIDLEKIVSLAPDLVILDSGFNRDRMAIERLGVKVLELRCERLDDVSAAMLTLGEVLEVQSTAELKAKDFRAGLERLKRPKGKEQVFVEIWGQPLMTAGGETLVCDVLEHLGFSNTYQELPGYFQVDPEDLVARRTSIVLVPIAEGQPHRSKAQELFGRVNLEPKVFYLDSDLLVRPGPRLLEGMRELVKSVR